MTARATVPLEPLAFVAIAGWADDDHAAALETFQRSCVEILAEGSAFTRTVMFGGKREQWIAVCRRAQDATDARRFFEQNFQPLRVSDPNRPEGLFTGYYEPEADGSRAPSKTYPVPLYGKPADLVAFDAATEKRLGLSYGRVIAGKPQPYFTRKEIEHGALAGRGLELVWLRDWADAFFMQIQGSGRVRLADGSLLRLAYAGKTGQPYTGIGGLLVERGAFSRDEMSMQATRAWMAKDKKAARELMWENKSFVFFREVDVADPHLGPPGAQKVLLTPRRSLAVDRSIWMFGTPVWLDTVTPSGAKGRSEIFRHLMIAQDTGTAIKGHVRGDVFWGAGEQAALTAGHMKSQGVMIVLLPKDLARELIAPP
ncbi:MAG TPA: murein transglycosylase A [Aestuariivirga sp.]|nr:murein transglycosylase A [Aestuariivirga sp.]